MSGGVASDHVVAAKRRILREKGEDLGSPLEEFFGEGGGAGGEPPFAKRGFPPAFLFPFPRRG